MTGRIGLIPKGVKQYRNLEKLSELLSENSSKGYRYFVGDTYLDYRRGWRYTTILCSVNGNTIQILGPDLYERVIGCPTDYYLKQLMEEYFKDKYCIDTKRPDLFSLV